MKIERVRAFPLGLSLESPQVTAQGAYTKVSICLVRIDTDNGLYGVGECLARFGALGYARVVEDLLAPKIVGRDPHSIKGLWDEMRSTLNGRSGGMLFEAIAGVDTALWDIKGKAFGVPVSTLLGGVGRSEVPVYASSIMVGEEVTPAARRILKYGFTKVKMKIGESVKKEVERIAELRNAVGPDCEIMVDANYIYDEYEALSIAEAAAAHRLRWLEEPINPENRNGYARLSSRSRVALAAGESEYTAHDTVDLLSSGALQFIQPDVTRSGGITECWRMATVADMFGVKYAPHVGFSGAVCVAASLQLAAAAPNTYGVECMTTPSAFREELVIEPVGLYNQVKDGNVTVPRKPGIGIEINWDKLEEFLL